MITVVLAILIVCLYWFFNGIKLNPKKLPPGPIGLPIVGYLPFLGEMPAVKIAKLGKIYGDVLSMRLGRQLVLFVNDVETMREMGKMDNFLGRNQLEIIKKHREKCGLIFLEQEGWTEWRRFTVKTLRDIGFSQLTLEKSIVAEVEEFRSFLGKNINKPIVLDEAIEISVLNSLWIILAGEKYDLEDEEKKEIFHIITEGIGDQNIIGIMCFLPWLSKLLPDYTGWSKALKCLGKPVDFSHRVITQHQEKYSLGFESDFVDLALTKIYSTTDPQSAFYKEVGLKNLLYTLMDLFFTGSDTVSKVLGWACIMMSVYPEIQKKIQKEIDSIVGRHNLPCVADRPKMVYTEAVMMEIFRFCPMSPLGIMHTALEEAEFRCFTIPKRTVILWNHHHAHHDPLYWGDPEVFRPERFINPNGTLRKDDHVIPFFVGKRSCPGESLAMNQYFLFLTGILQKFNVELADKDEVIDYRPRSAFICKPPRTKILVTQRHDL